MSILLCPNCQIGMQEIKRRDVQLDICSNCRGIWLDFSEVKELMALIQVLENENLPEDRENTSAITKEEQHPQREYQREHYNDPDRYHHLSSHPRKSVFECLREIFGIGVY